MDKKIKIAINGFGRIGRLFLRQIINEPSIEVVIINDLGDKDNLLYLLKYDSVYGKFEIQNPKSETNLKIENIKFNADEIYRVNIIGCGGIWLNTDDKVKITQVVKYFNSIVYYKKSKPQTHNNSPEAKVVFFDKNDKI